MGGGASRLAAHALRLGFGHVAVLDLSGEAIARSQAAMGSEADRVEWIVANLRSGNPDGDTTSGMIAHPSNSSLTRRRRAAYVETLDAALSDTGHAIIATFALDGPERRSGLPVQRYSPETLAETLGPRFTLVDSIRHEHQTPWGSTQVFQFSVLERAA